MNFAGELAGSDPMKRIAERVLSYRDHTYEYRLVKSLIGVLLSNVANNASDMIVDIGTATTGTPVTINSTQYTSPNFIRNAVIDAAGTLQPPQSTEAAPNNLQSLASISSQLKSCRHGFESPH